MSAFPHERRRPRQESGATTPARKSLPSIEALACGCLEDVGHLDDLARAIDGAFVVVVKVTGGKYRRRTFLTVASAQRAADNARALGHTATIYLSELRPLWRVVGGEDR